MHIKKQQIIKVFILKKIIKFISIAQSMKKLWHNISYLGVDTKMPLSSNRELVLTNKINALILVTMLAELIFESFVYFLHSNIFNLGSLRVFFVALVCSGNLILAKYHYTLLSRLSLIFFIPLLLFLFPIISDIGLREVVIWYPYAAITFSITPYLIFKRKKEATYLWVSVVYIMFYALFIDFIGILAGAENHLYTHITDSFITKFVQICIYIFISLSINYLLSINSLNEEQINTANNEIAEKSDLLQHQKKELEQQNSLLLINQKELNEKNSKLSEYQSVLFRQNEELKATLDKLKSIQEHLINTEKMASLGVFASGVSHEINNPINFITSGIEIIKEDINKISDFFDKFEASGSYKNKTWNIQIQDEELKDFQDLKQRSDIVLKNIDLGLNRIIEIIQNLQKLSPNLSSDWSLCNVNSLLDNCILMMEHKKEDNVTFVKYYEDVPEIFCNRNGIIQVFNNIILNAIEAVNSKGEIKIFTYQNRKDIIIKIEDNGKGIKQIDRNKIFEPFFTTKEVGKGMGLGLAIAYGIIKQHRGDINYESKTDKGTIFYIKLPVNEGLKS